MRIKQVKLAQTLPGESSNLLEEMKFDMSFDKGILTVKKKRDNPKNLGPFMVFPANIAWIWFEEDAAAAPVKPTEQVSAPVADDAKKSPGRPKKQ